MDTHFTILTGHLRFKLDLFLVK